jgi:hypothetical protein
VGLIVGATKAMGCGIFGTEKGAILAILLSVVVLFIS